jgi:hypothetical protein
MSFGGIPPLDQAQLPDSVRNASPAKQNDYRAALGFEQLLVQQLATTVTSTTQDALGGEDNPYASMLPDALTSSIMSAGGLGLASQLTDAMSATDSTDATATAPAGGQISGGATT